MSTSESSTREGLGKLGFDDGFAAQVQALNVDLRYVARVVTVHREGYSVDGGDGVFEAALPGAFHHQVHSAYDYPTVGDFVVLGAPEDGGGDTEVLSATDRDISVIRALLKRRNVLKRKSAYRRFGIQLLGANIDRAFVVMGLDRDFNLRRLERYLAMATDSDVEPVVLLSKSDVLSREDLCRRRSEAAAVASGHMVVAFSCLQGDNMQAVTSLFCPKKTGVLLGSSGTGKTSLINCLLGEDLFETRQVRPTDQRGRHTTTARYLVPLGNGALVVDSPGMRELGVEAVTTGIDDAFEDVAALATECRFRNCKHVSEVGCAVLAAVRDGLLDEKRYANFVGLSVDRDQPGTIRKNRGVSPRKGKKHRPGTKRGR